MSKEIVTVSLYVQRYTKDNFVIDSTFQAHINQNVLLEIHACSNPSLLFHAATPCSNPSRHVTMATRSMFFYFFGKKA